MQIKILSVSAGDSMNHVEEYLNTFKHDFKDVPLKTKGCTKFASFQICETLHELFRDSQPLCWQDEPPFCTELKL